MRRFDISAPRVPVFAHLAPLAETVSTKELLQVGANGRPDWRRMADKKSRDGRSEFQPVYESYHLSNVLCSRHAQQQAAIDHGKSHKGQDPRHSRNHVQGRHLSR